MTTEVTATERKTISINAASELVDVNRRTIYNWIDSGKVEYIRTAGGAVRIFVDTLWRSPDRPDSIPSTPAWVHAGHTVKR